MHDVMGAGHETTATTAAAAIYAGTCARVGAEKSGHARDGAGWLHDGAMLSCPQSECTPCRHLPAVSAHPEVEARLVAELESVLGELG